MGISEGADFSAPFFIYEISLKHFSRCESSIFSVKKETARVVMMEIGREMNMGSTMLQGAPRRNGLPKRVWESPMAMASFSRTKVSQKALAVNPA